MRMRFWKTSGTAVAFMTYSFALSLWAQEERDPAAWGSDHVGRAIPMYMTGGECLFCHREDIGNAWQSNRHNLGMRAKELLSPTLKAILDDYPELYEETHYVLGGKRVGRLLKPNGKYGQFAMHESRLVLPQDESHREWEFENTDKGWDGEIFANRCAGCHTTAVETAYNAFYAPSLDCYTCHGDVPQGQQNRPELTMFSKKKTRKTPLVDISTCAQCHLRGGKSRSSGLPYPNQFVAGDNLFKDFEVDLREESIAALDPAEQHIFRNVRDVVVLGKEDMTCVTCHSVHAQSTSRHRELPWAASAALCATCHDKADDLASVRRFERHSAVCEY